MGARWAAVALVSLVAALLAGCSSPPVFGSEAAAGPGQEATAFARASVVAGRTATAGVLGTATAVAAAEREAAEAALLAERRATMGAQTFLAQTAAAERALRQTAAALTTPTRAAAAPAAAAAAPAPTAPPPTRFVPTRVPDVRLLRFVKLNENDDPTCISVGVRGVATNGWTFRVDGMRATGTFDGAGNARVCGLAPRQEVTISVYNARGARVPGGQGVQSRGSAIMRAEWR
jgi:hypothetical protein